MVLSQHHLPLLAALAATVAACGGGGNVSNASPRISSVPMQSTNGDSAFSLDLANYVSDRESPSLTYAVTSGGGSFAGSVYSNTFATMGTYTVAFTVTDGDKVTTGTFDVRVTDGSFVVVKEDQSGLLLLDSRTNETVRVAAAVTAPTFVTGLADGRLVYGKNGASGDQLWVFDPLTRTNVQLSPNADGDLVYEAKTSDGRLLYTEVGTVETTLHMFNPRTGLDREIAVGTQLDAFVDSADLVYYEVAIAGQADVYAYDVEDDTAQVVGDGATAEQVVGVVPGGGIVMSRVGGSGETDLFFWKRSVGLVEVGADLTAIAGANKTFHAAGTGNKVVFTAATGGTSELHVWNQATGQTTNLTTVTGGGFDVFVALAAGNEVVWNRVVSGSEVDAFFYDLDNATNAAVRDGADVSQVLGVTGDGTTNWAIVRPTGTPTSLLAISLIGTPATANWNAGGAKSTTIGTLGNGDVVGALGDGTQLQRFDVSAGAWGGAVNGAGLAFAGAGLDVGDYVYTATVSSQTDLNMWDESGTTSVVVSDVAGNDVFQARTADGTVLFTRVVAGNTNADLFVWNGTTATRLTQADAANLLHDHTVLGQYAGAR